MKGIVRQGVRCKDCGITCHKHCKDDVVVDCSRHTEKKSECHETCVHKQLFDYTDKRTRRNTGSVSTNGEYDIDNELSIKARLKRAESVSNNNQLV